MKRWLVMLAFVLALVGVLGGIKYYEIQKMIAGFKAAGTPKQTVTATAAKYDEWRERLSAIGTARAVKGADLGAEVAGIVDAIDFESGQDVAADQVLVRLRAADERARLASLEATAELARLTYERNRKQFAAKAISQEQLETDAANLKSARAQVAEQRALIDKKTVRAPFAGRLGIRAVDLGQYLAAGTRVVRLEALDPIHVDFNLPQQALHRVRTGQSVTVTTDSYPGLELHGTVSAIAPTIDSDTRNLALRATLANPDHKLLPGMFVRVSIEVGKPARYLTVPQTAVTYNPYGETVFLVVKPDQLEKGTVPAGVAADQPVAKQVFVTVGPTRGDQVAITKGVSEGDQVVTSGQIKLKNGTPIVIDNRVVPSDEPNPHPENE